MHITQLTAAQLEELAQSYLTEHYSEYDPAAADRGEAPSWGELAAALEIVGRKTLMQEYESTEFSPDDFTCTATPAPTRKAREAVTYDVREVWALPYEDGWYYNETFHISTFKTRAQDEARAFRRALNRMGIVFIKGRTRTEYDGDVFEIVDRKTGEPLFCAVPTWEA